MADNIEYTGTGATVPANTKQRTDDLGAAGHVPYVKVLNATDDATDTAGALTNNTLGDGTTNPSTGRIASFLKAFNGSTWDRLRTVGALLSPPNVKTGVLAVGNGPGWDDTLNPSNLGTATNSASAMVIAGSGTVLIHIGTTTTGTFVIEVSGDDSAWISAPAIDTQTDLWVTGNLTPTNGKTYAVRTGAWRQIRLRTTATLGATVAHKFTGHVTAQMIRAIDTGPAPHNIGYAIVFKTAQYTTTQTGAVLWTPGTGKKIVVTSYQIQVGGTTAGTMQLFFNNSTTYTRGTHPAVFDGEFAPSSTSKPGVVQTGVFVSQTADHHLRVTTSAAINPLTVNVWGYEF